MQNETYYTIALVIIGVVLLWTLFERFVLKRKSQNRRAGSEGSTLRGEFDAD
jgi:hypothetical protein